MSSQTTPKAEAATNHSWLKYTAPNSVAARYAKGAASLSASDPFSQHRGRSRFQNPSRESPIQAGLLTSKSNDVDGSVHLELEY